MKRKKNFEKEQSDPLVEIQNLTVRFRSSKGFLRKKTEDVLAVDGIDLTIQKGKTLGLVGESGCGKTSTGRAILHLIRPTSGEVLYEGKSLGNSSEKLIEYRKKMQIIFQDPCLS